MVHGELRITTWASAYSSTSTSMKNPLEGVAGSSVKRKLSNMSTKVLSKTYIRSYIHAHYQEGLVELLQQASFDSWLGYSMRLQLEMVLRTRVHYSPIQYTTEDPPPSPCGRAILGTHTYLEAFSSFHLLVYELYRQPSSPLPWTRLFE